MQGVILILTLVCVEHVHGHGKMIDPPGRNAVMNPTGRRRDVPWTDCPNRGLTNTDDTALNCGGRGTQHQNGGKCGACGDPYRYSGTRPHEYGGCYATDITPVRAYKQGQILTVFIHLSAPHLGSFQFRICNMVQRENDQSDELTECFDGDDKITLSLADNSGTNYTRGTGSTTHHEIDLQLPPGLKCPYGCTFQWWYRAGNNPEPTYQEHFVNCADIVIMDCVDFKTKQYKPFCALGATEELKSCEDEYVSGVDSNSGSTSSGGHTSGHGSNCKNKTSNTGDSYYDSDPTYDSGPSYESGPTYDSGPNYDSGPTYNNGQTYDNDQTYENGPTYDSGPTYNSGPAYDDGPTYNNGPTYDNEPNYDSGPSYNNGPTYETGPAYDSGQSYDNGQTNNVGSTGNVDVTCTECYAMYEDSYCNPCCTTTTSCTGLWSSAYDNWCSAYPTSNCLGSHCKLVNSLHKEPGCMFGNSQSLASSGNSCNDCNGHETCQNTCCTKETTYHTISPVATDQWCTNNCLMNYCPQNFCEVRTSWEYSCKRSLVELLKKLIKQKKSVEN